MYKNLYGNDDHIDVIFKIENEDIKSHKCILSAESQYFKTLFSTKLAKGVTRIDNIDYIEMDINVETFKCIIKYIYMGEINIDKDNLCEIANLAEMFFIESLKTKCKENFYVLFHNIDDFLSNLEFIKNVPFIETLSIDYILTYWNELIIKPKFYEIINKDLEYQKKIYNKLSDLIKNSPKELKKVEESDKDKIKNYIIQQSDKIKNRGQQIELLKILEDPIKLYSNSNNFKNICKNFSLEVPLWYKSKYL